MKLSNPDSSKNLLIESFKVLFFFLFAVFASASATSAQKINDDLQPSVKPPVKQQSPTAPRGRVPKQPKIRQQPRKPEPVYNAPPPVAAVVHRVAPAAPVQTPTQIIERFADFQNSTSVTEKDWQSVVSQTSATLQSNPSDDTAKGQLFFAQGQLAFIRSDFSTALVHFNAAAEKLSDSPLPRYGIGKVYLATKQPQEAENAFEKAIKFEKTFALAYKGLGDAMTARGKTKKAQEYYKKAGRVGLVNDDDTAAEKGNPVANQSNNQSDAPTGASESSFESDLKIAREYTAKKKWQMALDKLQPYERTNPSAELYITIGDSYFGLEAWLSAQQAYRKATEANPNSALAFYKSGMVLYEMNEFQSAAEAFERALILDQSGTIINRSQARKMANKAREKVRDANKNGKR